MKRKQVLWCVFSDVDTTGTFNDAEAFTSYAEAKKYMRDPIPESYIIGPVRVVVDTHKARFFGGKS